ncbi:MAG: hypothetical protein R3D00_23155 [Bacteroidia bacterium]
MWKNIEKYINDHRDDIDRDIPGDKVWARIEKDLTRNNVKRKKRNLFDSPLWKAAAVIMMLAGIGYIWANLLADPNRPNAYTSSLLNGIQRMETGFPELQEVDAHYSHELQERMDVIETYDLKQYPFTAEYMDKLKQIDQQIIAEKLSLKKNGLENMVVQTLIENYNHKIALLDSLKAELDNAR